MTLLQAVVLGIVQGLTEFLPISSTAHLRIVPAIFGWNFTFNAAHPHDPGAPFTAVVQLGTTLAIVLYFWRELLHVTVAWFRGLFDQTVRHSLEYRMGWYLILATIPVSVFGLALSHQIETGARNLWLIASALITLAVVLFLAERVGSRERDEEELNTMDALVVGTAQALALIPGSSRSGTTITAGLFRGLDRADRGPLLVPALDPRGGAVRRLRGGQARRTTARPRRRAHRRRGDLRVRRRAGLDRLADALARPAQHDGLHLLPHRCSALTAVSACSAPASLDRDEVAQPMSTLLLVRHGLTAMTGPVLAGRTPGVHLDERGAEAGRGGRRALAAVPLTAVVTSPMERCAETAEVDRRGAARAPAATRRGTSTTGSTECGYGDWTGRARSRTWPRTRCGRSCRPSRRRRGSPAGRASPRCRPGPLRRSATGTPASARTRCGSPARHGDVIKADARRRARPAPRPVPAHRPRPVLGVGGAVHRDPAVRGAHQRHRRRPGRVRAAASAPPTARRGSAGG